MADPTDKPSAAHELLDTVERLLFGDVGGAERAVRAFDGDPLARLRAEQALDAERRAAEPPKPDPQAARARRAQEELNALKQGSSDTPPGPPPEAAQPSPRKRTL